MTRLSSLQYALGKQLSQMGPQFGIKEARKFDQRPFGSFGKRGYIRRYGDSFAFTKAGREAIADFGQMSIYRKLISDKLSVHFKEHLAPVKKEKGKAKEAAA